METLNIANTNTKEILVQMINKAIDDNKWSSKEIAHVLQTPLSDISRIRRSKAANFSLARLLTFLVRLDYRVTILINMKETTKQIEYLSLQLHNCSIKPCKNGELTYWSFRCIYRGNSKRQDKYQQSLKSRSMGT